MARWRLTNPHYLNVPGTEWEYKETNRDTGRQARKVFPVPLYLNPSDPADHNYREDGEIIVAHEGPGVQRKDLIFIGPPTPDMEPLDEEAKAISEAESVKWIHPIEDMAADGGYSQSLLHNFEQQIIELNKKLPAVAASAISKSMVGDDAFNKLMEQVQALAASNAELQAQLAALKELPVEEELEDA